MANYTQEQTRAIQSLSRRICVDAGAGSGKTRVLVDRIVHLLEGGLGTLDDVVAITFTEKAAGEMKQRLRLAFRDRASTEDPAQMTRWREFPSLHPLPRCNGPYGAPAPRHCALPSTRAGPGYSRHCGRIGGRASRGFGLDPEEARERREGREREESLLRYGGGRRSTIGLGPTCRRDPSLALGMTLGWGMTLGLGDDPQQRSFRAREDSSAGALAERSFFAQAPPYAIIVQTIRIRERGLFVMKLLSKLGLCAVICLFWAAANAGAALVDGVVATVDNEIILHSELIETAAPLLADLQQTASREDFQREADKVLRDALDQAIERKLLYRQAQLAGMEVTDEQVEERIATIRKQYETDEEFQKMVSEAGAMTEFRDRVRQQVMAITMGNGKREQFKKEAVVSESEMRQYYQDHVAEFAKPERVNVSRLFLPGGATPAEREKARAQLAALKEELALGSDFAELAKKYSQGPDAANGGLVGWVARGDLVASLEEAAFALPVGGVSDILETEFGFTMLKVNEKNDAGTGSFEEEQTEIEPMLRLQYAQDRYVKWLEELRKRSRVMTYL